jgi:hypothetical protein
MECITPVGGCVNHVSDFAQTANQEASDRLLVLGYQDTHATIICSDLDGFINSAPKPG